MSKKIALGLGLIMSVACSAANEGPTTDVEQPTTELGQEIGKPNCALVLCALPVCSAGEVLETKPNQCCPQCVPAKPRLRDGDCGCAGGAMDSSYCSQFGAPWTWNGWACVWSAKSQGGLASDQCAAVEAKHAGDGSGSDIYNLGMSCIYGGGDCRSKGCPSGQHCDICKTVDGAAYVCLPDGAVC